MRNEVLIVIDLQTGAFDGVRWPAIPEAERLLSNGEKLLKSARASGIPVIFVQHCEGAGEVFEENSIHWQFHKRVAPQPGETVVMKRASSAFENTGLEQILRSRQIEVLVLCGLQSEFCVSNTAKSALQLGFHVILAQDAHGTWPAGGESADSISARVNRELQALGATLKTTASLTPVWGTVGLGSGGLN